MTQSIGGYQPTSLPFDEDTFDPFAIDPANQDAEAGTIEIILSPTQETAVVNGRLYAIPGKEVTTQQPLGEAIIDAFSFALRVVFTFVSVGCLIWVVYNFLHEVR